MIEGGSKLHTLGPAVRRLLAVDAETERGGQYGRFVRVLY